METGYYRSASVQGAASLIVSGVAAPGSSTGSTPFSSSLTLKSFYVSNRNAAARYIWISIVSAGGAPFAGLVMLVPASGGLALGKELFGEGGLAMTKNQFFVNVSTSSTTFTAATDADHDLSVYYRE